MDRQSRRAERPPEIVISSNSRAHADAVYGALEDLRSHLEWSGERNHRSFRLLTLEAEPGPAGVGTEWRSTGKDPGGMFTDRSVVTEAVRPTRFEYVTESRFDWRRGKRPAMEATIVSRFDIEPRPGGSRITWRSQTVQMKNAPRFMTAPILRWLARRSGGLYSRRAVRNLARFAEERARIVPESKGR
jgi:hypothetical protein